MLDPTKNQKEFMNDLALNKRESCIVVLAQQGHLGGR